MSEANSHVEVERGSERSFGFVFAGAFFLLAAAAYYYSGKTLLWALALSLAFFLIALVVPKALKPFNIFWFKLGMLIGAVVAPIVMMLIFFAVVTPIGLLMRMFGKDPLRLRRNPLEGSYWIKRERDPENPASMKNQF